MHGARFVTVVFGLVLLSACNLREYAVMKAVNEQANYVPDEAHYGGWDIQKLSDRVHTFRWGWYRNIVVRTDEGFVVIDPFNRAAATTLKSELAKIAPGQPVHTLFYSHYHLDHTVGGGALAPQRVVAHARCPSYWADLGDTRDAKDVLPPTELIDGDQEITIGGVEFRLLYLGRTHTDTLYAYYLPQEKLLFTADLALIRAVFPLGGPDMYTPGIVKQLDRLAQLDFDTYVPSHFGYGKKRDFLESAEFHRTVHRLSIETLEKYGLPKTGEEYERGFRAMYDPLKAKYGEYHGFDEEILFVIGRAFSGALLGY